MGSWSVSCGISNIAITSGNKCVLVPLRKNNQDYGYFEYIPAMLPIFGEYDDYGGIGEIEKNANTELIERVTGVTIEEFCVYLVDGKHTYNRDEAKNVAEQMQHIDSFKNIRFMWMDRKVYDYMTSSLSSDGYGGCIGYRFILDKLGFTFVGKDKGKERHKQIWERDGKRIYSDGTWIVSETGKTIFDFNAEYYTDQNLSFYFDLTEEELAYQNGSIFSFYENMNEEEANKHLLRLITRRTDSVDYTVDIEALWKANGIEPDEKMKSFVERMKEEKIKNLGVLHSEYYENIMQFKKEFAELGNLYRNLYPMSGTFRPHELYLTPQCGEYREHQLLLEKFAEINKSYIDEFEEE